MHLESTALKFLEESLDRLKKKIFIAKVKGLVHRFNSRSDLYHNYDLFFISSTVRLTPRFPKEKPPKP